MQKGSDMFYVFFHARNPPKSGPTPLLLWITGGPGWSGFAGLYMENGPRIIN